MVTDDSVLFSITASTGGSGGCFLAAVEGMQRDGDALYRRTLT